MSAAELDVIDVCAGCDALFDKGETVFGGAVSTSDGRITAFRLCQACRDLAEWDVDARRRLVRSVMQYRVLTGPAAGHA
jgi:hypothetical protein